MFTVFSSFSEMLSNWIAKPSSLGKVGGIMRDWVLRSLESERYVSLIRPLFLLSMANRKGSPEMFWLVRNARYPMSVGTSGKFIFRHRLLFCEESSINSPPCSRPIS